jgi:5-methylcytosine-specific restriction endonuclease McrA
MPCHPARSRELLKNGRARVHKLYPFTIRLTDRTVAESEVDGVQLKIDPGSRYTGISVARTDPDGTVHGLYAIEAQHRGHLIRKRMVRRAQLRHSRRSRKLRYRRARFHNRTRPEGWLAPSLRHLVEGAQTWVTRLSHLAPVTGLVMELVRFDTQRMQNPEISGTEYQQGTLFGYEVREYLLLKWHHQCAYCAAAGVPLTIDHIRPRARGGSNRISNLTLACVPCNQAKDARDVSEFVADPARLSRILAQAKAPLHDAAAVNSTRWALYRALASTGLPVDTGSGGRTKWNRTRSGAPKSHSLDALCIGDIAAIGSWPGSVLVARSTGRGAYQRALHDKYGFPRKDKDGKPAVKTRVKQHYGFSTGDLVRAVVPSGKKAGTHIGRVAVRKTGSFNITTALGVIQGISYRHCRLLHRADGWTYARKEEARASAHHHDDALLPALNDGVSARATV